MKCKIRKILNSKCIAAEPIVIEMKRDNEGIIIGHEYKSSETKKKTNYELSIRAKW